MKMINVQNIAWLWDLYSRKLLDLDPPYRKRSIWNQEDKDYFVDTVLNEYPSPVILIYQEITPEGLSKISVIDGKQRLSTLFAFVENQFPVSDRTKVLKFRGKYFKDFEGEDKQLFWKYSVAIEYLPSCDEKFLEDILKRLDLKVDRTKLD
jgi:Protein of unknown function DUF262